LKASRFVSILKNIAKEQKTVYAWGMFGTPITKSTVTGKAKQYPYWYTDSKINSVFAPIYRSNSLVWGFDCVGLVKGVLWGWNGDSSKAYGGAVYASNGVPDISADAMINRCSNVSSNNFNSLGGGEFLWMKGHCGVYIGNGQVVESTPQWNNGVQITNINSRNWLKHGKLPYIEYDAEEKVEEARNTVKIELTVLQKGSKGSEVKTLQRLLKALSYKDKNGKVLAIDGDFGGNTDYSLRSYQQTKGLSVDGICGLYTWESLLK
jgi:peptidoglycan hydrolase-like protein with peptidoglycan-binding domain